MKVVIAAMLVLSAIVTTAPAPVAQAGCAVGSVCYNCSGNTSTGSVCVNGSGNCSLGSVCVGSSGNCYTASVCINQTKSAAFGAIGSFDGFKKERPCGGSTLIAVTYLGGSWSYSQYIAADTTTARPSCGAEGGSGLTLHRAYSSADEGTYHTDDGSTLTFVKYVQGGPNPWSESREVTQIHLGNGGPAYFTQVFETDGKPTWHAQGYLTSTW